MKQAILIILIAVILYIAFKFFKTEGNSKNRDINFNIQEGNEAEDDGGQAEIGDGGSSRDEGKE